MTTAESRGLMKSLLNSMWAFWMLLLTVSLGLAALIYEIWLKGNL